jgi:hypothetical protein
MTSKTVAALLADLEVTRSHSRPRVVDAGAKKMVEQDADDAAAAANPYGAILGYHDPNLDAGIIFTTVCFRSPKARTGAISTHT